MTHASGLQFSFAICAGEISGRVGGKNIGIFHSPALSKPSGVNSARVVHRYLNQMINITLFFQSKKKVGLYALGVGVAVDTSRV